MRDALDDIRAAAALPDAAPPPAAAPARVFAFWAQGAGRAPDLVRRCLEETARLHEPGEVVVLDGRSMHDWVELPGLVVDAIGDDWTHMSDVLRLELLSRHGGAWLDATCLPRTRLTPLLPGLLAASGFFAFRRRPVVIATWFVAAEPGHYVTALWREAQRAYLRRSGRVEHYFFSHHCFEALCHLDPPFSRLWRRTPILRARSAAELRRALTRRHDPERFGALLDGAFLHKLTYKLPPSALERDTMARRLISGGPLP